MDDAVTALVERPDTTHVVREFQVPSEDLSRDADGWTAAGAVVWNPSDEVAFVETEWSDGWVLPGGGVEAEESFAAAARREVREETGIDCDVLGPRRIEEQVFRADGESTRGWFVAFAARTDATEFGDDLGAHSSEIQRAGWFDGAPADTADRVDAAAMLRDCRVG